MSLPVTCMWWWRLPILRDAPWRISSIITTILLLLLSLLLLLLFPLLLLLLLLVVERINYSVIHIMAGMSTQTGPLTGPGALCRQVQGYPCTLVKGCPCWLVQGHGCPCCPAQGCLHSLTQVCLRLHWPARTCPHCLDQTQHAAVTWLMFFLWFYLYQLICYS